LNRHKNWRDRLDRLADDGVYTLLIAQLRSLYRVHGGAIEGIHPYVVKKLRAVPLQHAEELWFAANRALYASRTGGAAGFTETETLI
jgi:hypothetical protein